MSPTRSVSGTMLAMLLLAACSDRDPLAPSRRAPNLHAIPSSVQAAFVHASYNCVVGATTTTCTFPDIAQDQPWTVPAGVTSVDIDALGSRGYDRYGLGGFGGPGGRATATFDVVAGSVLHVSVGNPNGFNGGGLGGGGGASDVRTGAGTLADRIIVAGGGGGAGINFVTPVHFWGGAGGGLSGAAGADDPIAPGFLAGGGGTQTAGGTGSSGGFTAGANGGLGVGGASGGSFAGGGGGGYYGGGGGANVGHTEGGGGGGGSGYIAPTGQNGSMDTGVNANTGSVSITFQNVALAAGWPASSVSEDYAYVGTPLTISFKAFGSPTPSVSLIGTLPTGLTFTSAADGTATISGSPATLTAGTYALTFSASNGVGSPATLPVTISVLGRPTTPFFVYARGPGGEYLDPGIGLSFGTTPALACSGTFSNGSCGLNYTSGQIVGSGGGRCTFLPSDDLFPLTTNDFIDPRCYARAIAGNAAPVSVSTAASTSLGGVTFLFDHWDTSAQGVPCNAGGPVTTCTFAAPGAVNLTAAYRALVALTTTVTLTPGTPNGTNGWYTTAVGVSVSASVSGAGVSTRCAIDPATQPQSFDDLPVGACPTSVGADGSHVLYAATNDNGLKGAVTSASFKIDRTAPTLSPSVSPNPVLLNGTATATPNAADVAGSGVASSSCAAVITNAVGVKSVTCTATDNAGNTTNKSASYSVVFGFSGFASPIDDGGVLNIAKAGRVIPIKWRLLDAGGNPVTTLPTVTVTVATLACAVGATSDAIEEYAAGSSGLQNQGNGYYQFNWATPSSYANSCKTMRLDLGEGSVRTALFQFK